MKNTFPIVCRIVFITGCVVFMAGVGLLIATVARRVGPVPPRVVVLDNMAGVDAAKWKAQDFNALTAGWNDGFNFALDAMALLNLEQQLTHTNRTFGEMNAVLRQRFHVPEPRSHKPLP